MFENHKYYVGYNHGDLVFGYTKRTNGFSMYPSHAFNMALYIGDNEENVHRHQELLSEEIGIKTSQWVMPIQGHHNHVYEVTRVDAGTNVKALSECIHHVDALFTYERDILLAMNYADCTPIFIYSVKDSFIGLVHAGWKGTKHNVLTELLKYYSGDIDNLRVVIGVTINKDYYEVDHHVVNESFKVHHSAVESLDGNKFLLDLKEANKQEAIKFGIKEENIYVTEIGTESKEFFSFRLEKGETGRALGFIGRKSID